MSTTVVYPIKFHNKDTSRIVCQDASCSACRNSSGDKAPWCDNIYEVIEQGLDVDFWWNPEIMRPRHVEIHFKLDKDASAGIQPVEIYGKLLAPRIILRVEKVNPARGKLFFSGSINPYTRGLTNNIEDAISLGEASKPIEIGTISQGEGLETFIQMYLEYLNSRLWIPGVELTCNANTHWSNRDEFTWRYLNAESNSIKLATLWYLYYFKTCHLCLDDFHNAMDDIF